MSSEHNYSDFVIYGDETGDPSLNLTYAEHPIFALVLCIFSKIDYSEHAIKYIKTLKFTFWGHDAVIFHSSKLRKQIGDFQFLQNIERRIFFLNTLSTAIQKSPFTIIATAIDKRLLKEKYKHPKNPYDLSLEYCLERVYRFLEEKNQKNKVTHIILESRGKEMDAVLEAAFNLIVQKNISQTTYPLQLLFVDKRVNLIGLQIADLAAHPIGRFAVDPNRENPAFDILKNKLYKYPNHQGKGLKIFPYQSEIQSLEKRKAPELSEA